MLIYGEMLAQKLSDKNFNNLYISFAKKCSSVRSLVCCHWNVGKMGKCRVCEKSMGSHQQNFINFLSTKYGLCSAMSFAQVWCFSKMLVTSCYMGATPILWRKWITLTYWNQSVLELHIAQGLGDCYIHWWTYQPTDICKAICPFFSRGA